MNPKHAKALELCTRGHWIKGAKSGDAQSIKNLDTYYGARVWTQVEIDAFNERVQDEP